MKLLTFHGPGHFLEARGIFKIAVGESVEVSDHVAEALVRANPELALTITDPQPAEPEAHEGEGQATAIDPQEE